MDRLSGKVVLVTGAGRGFGAAIATGVAQEGADVIVHYNRSRSGAEQTVKKIRDIGRDALPVQADLTSWDSIRAAVSQAIDYFGRIDVLINNVGDMAPEQMSWRDINEDIIDRVLAVDIKGTMLMTHEVGLRMLERESGVIVNIGSHVVVGGSARAPQYAAGKYGVIGLTKSYAHAFAPHVRVNALGPGFIETETTLQREDWRSGRREKVLNATPLRRLPKPEDLVSAVTFLACDDSKFITGAFLIVDGGYFMVGA
ncbi:MAG: glucose 1-dehydrogenase [Alicyclobacillus sp.]|nr:glucose 1-dehydrogenase [Alicyclobacillus sp.]